MSEQTKYYLYSTRLDSLKKKRKLGIWSGIVIGLSFPYFLYGIGYIIKVLKVVYSI